MHGTKYGDVYINYCGVGRWDKDVKGEYVRSACWYVLSSIICERVFHAEPYVEQSRKASQLYIQEFHRSPSVFPPANIHGS